MNLLREFRFLFVRQSATGSIAGELWNGSIMEPRLQFVQPDYLFRIVRRPSRWRPDGLCDAPPNADILAESLVASYEEAHDDLVRCNRAALRWDLNRWAVIVAAEGGL